MNPWMHSSAYIALMQQCPASEHLSLAIERLHPSALCAWALWPTDVLECAQFMVTHPRIYFRSLLQGLVCGSRRSVLELDCTSFLCRPVQGLDAHLLRRHRRDCMPCTPLALPICAAGISSELGEERSTLARPYAARPQDRPPICAASGPHRFLPYSALVRRRSLLP